jgi:hypothetical protein
MNYFVRDLAHTSMCIARADGTQKIWHKTKTGFFCQVEDYDPDGMHSTAVSPNIFTPNIAGRYVVTGFVEFAASSAGTYRQIEVALNAVTSTEYGFNRSLEFSANFATFLCMRSVPIACNGTTDNLQVVASHDNGGESLMHNGAVCVYRLRG